MFQIHGVLDLIFWILAIIAFGMSIWALVHALRTPARAFAVAGKQTKKLWTIILGFATLFSFASAVGYFGIGLGQLNIFAIAAVIAAGIYLADVKPAVSQTGKGGNSGPYGPW
ncbi:DUF2516 family protein [Planomonospora venezuelensis]|uniref:DUF2516 family protein n=1 Tax=Planomonospora venezuelensis TaxID=1999 RepID=A0A841D1Q0_PLAVE|nr:DUF2516 family protein [Planomonospora venezuelensis]MBB5961446.1 hypothetical protein [Planomonospora venezuelensis]GIN03192.1 hypothetical protein Pve01_48500 [Planomonospora venezuelensis]